MTDKELLSQLNNLKSIKPDSQWKAVARDILFNQISSGGAEIQKTEAADLGALFIFKKFVSYAARPAGVLLTVLAVVLGGGVFSIYAARDSKPGDSLYIAKMISEKAQLVVTFDQKEKAKLELGFASNRAKEITQVLSEPGNGEREQKVEKLSKDFKKEIFTAKTRLEKINMAKGSKQTAPAEEEAEVFSANLGKEDKGVQVYSSQNNNTAATAEKSSVTVKESEASAEKEPIAPPKPNDLQTTLDEAEKLFDSQDYHGTLSKLEEATSLIDGVNKNIAPAVPTGETENTTEGAPTTIEKPAADKQETTDNTAPNPATNTTKQ